ncbi:mismatch-specific DNA-glycosylase [Corynebacterium hansenii]|uniref:Mismatch-specific DNA-glycosylase n=1 Tax=Corynebacterium hansenii TaxID=394964 RepID=A0ABV7ZLN2_9CORY|nr:mismatch-specific DNA-glycosylase [Corynebacterium hansenii]WJY98690.1 G/U mismatch-specific DNA glycosylase [Corynebacterium hansenii]
MSGDLDSFRDAVIDDINVDACRLLVVGINPGLWTAKVGAPFARPGNRFWPALHEAGITPRLVDAREGLCDDDLRMLARVGLGFTNVVARATARAGELSDEEIRAGGRILDDKVARQREARGGPEIVMVAGIGAFRTAFGAKTADGEPVAVGKQDREIGGAETWVVPNPSGLNAHETVASLARAYHEVWERLG